MTSLDYLAFIGPECGPVDEIANALRTSTYMVNGLRPPTFVNVKACGCDALPELLGVLCDGSEDPGAGYTTPADDNAPWYDPLIPESALFAGVLVTSIDGLDSTPVERTSIRLQEGGAILGPLIETERTITVVAELHGASCCAVAYGIRWLSSLLRRWCTDDGCEPPDLAFLQGCPDTVEACTGATVDETVRSPWRLAPRVGLVEGPTVTSRRGAGCGSCGCNPTVQVEFTLLAGLPGVFTEPVDVVAQTSLLPAGENDNCLDLVWKCAPDPECDVEEAIFDAACGNLPPPPTPQVPVSCLCDPLAVHRMIVPLTFDVPERFHAVVSVTLTAGELPLRNVAVRLYAPDGDGCGETYPACDVLASLGVSYVPPNATLVVDSVRRRSYITLDTGDRYAGGRFVFAASGSPFQWLDVPCGGGYCLSIEADAFNTYDGATVALSAAIREG